MAEKPTYHEFLYSVFETPAEMGAKGLFYVLAALPLMILVAMLSLVIFPEGTYPTIVLVLPGVVAGLICVYLLGFIVHLLPTFLSIPFCLIAIYFTVSMIIEYGSAVLRAFGMQI